MGRACFPIGRDSRASQRNGCLFLVAGVDGIEGHPYGSDREGHKGGRRKCALLETSPEREPCSQPEVVLPVVRE